ncbi:MAG: glycosyltransferase [Saprospiraceae bacterium]
MSELPSAVPRHIICTVTNDLSYDQRMIRICTALVEMGYAVTLVGRELEQSQPLSKEVFHQKRLRCRWNAGKMFYLEYNLRLWWWLLWQRMDAVCSVDLDTILPGWFVCFLRRKVQIYDAHEYFTETPEVVRRPAIQRIWAAVARFCIPKIKHCYTVGDGLAQIFTKRYGVPFKVVRNVPFYRGDQIEKIRSRSVSDLRAASDTSIDTSADVFSNVSTGGLPILFYQGALNEGRGLEQIIAAMTNIDAQLWLAGEGDLSQDLRQLVTDLKLEKKVKFLGFVQPKDLPALTLQATIGLNLLENRGLSYFYSLANKAFDYVQACVPSINMAFPEYLALQKEYGTYYLIENLERETLVEAVNDLLNNDKLYAHLVENCLRAREVLHWEKEKERLREIYADIWE